MDQQQIENTIQFLVENQAKFHSDLELLKESQQKTDAQIQALTETIGILSERVDDVVGAIDVMRTELRESFDNLIIGNEVTRNFANEIGKLIVNVSQRLTSVEQRLDEQNGKQ
jgi:hypothetical protein